MRSFFCFAFGLAIIAAAALAPDPVLARGASGGSVAATSMGGHVVIHVQSGHPHGAPHTAAHIALRNSPAAIAALHGFPFPHYGSYPYYPFGGWYGGYGGWYGDYGGYPQPAMTAPEPVADAPHYFPPPPVAINPMDLPLCRETVAGVTIIRARHCRA